MDYSTRENEISNEELFSNENTLPVRFFYKLPRKVRDNFLPLFDEMLSINDRAFIRAVSRVDVYMHDISPERFKIIMNHTEDSDYFSFYEYYSILQPVIETIINANDLYDEYPEYLV